MEPNSKVILTGNMGSETCLYEDKNQKLFAAFSLATSDSYRDKNDDNQWKQRPVVWHNNILVFQPKLVDLATSFSKGTRLKVTGILDYEDFKTKEKGKSVTKQAARIIATGIEAKPLVCGSDQPSQS